VCIGLVFCVFLGVNTEYLYQLPDEFSKTLKQIDELFENHTILAVGSGDTKTAFGIFLMKNKYGYTDKQEINQTLNATIEDNTIDKIMEALED
jgi:hypothetical protein